MKRIYSLIIMLVLCISMMHAQHHWTCNIYDFQYDMTMYVALKLNGIDVAASDDYEVAAFCGDECRGVAIVETIEAIGTTYYYLRVRSNVENGEEISFKCYDKNAQEEIIVSPNVDVNFVSSAIHAYPSTPILLVGAKKVDVIFSVDGVETKTTQDVGSVIVAPANPVKEGHTFRGWSPVFVEGTTVPMGGVTYVALFDVNTYKVNYVIDGENYKSVDVVYNETIPVEPSPLKEGHTFSGWSEFPTTMPAHDVEVTGSYIVNVYALTYYVDSLEYHTDSVAYGDTIILPEIPVKDGYEFSGWNEVPVVMPFYDVRVDGKFVLPSAVNMITNKNDLLVTVYSLCGTLIRKNIPLCEALEDLPCGLYIVNGVKMYVSE